MCAYIHSHCKMLFCETRNCKWYNIDIAALRETRIAGECQLEEVGAGYKFLCIRHPEGQARQAGVGFAIRTTLLSHMVSQPHGISPRIMTMHLQLEHGRSMVLIYDCFDFTIRSIPFIHRLLLLGDFNACVGCDIVAWPKIMVVTQLEVKTPMV